MGSRALLGSTRVGDSLRPLTHTHTCVTSGLPPCSSLTPSIPGWQEPAPAPPMHLEGPQATWVGYRHLTGHRQAAALPTSPPPPRRGGRGAPGSRWRRGWVRVPAARVADKERGRVTEDRQGVGAIGRSREPGGEFPCPALQAPAGPCRVAHFFPETRLPLAGAAAARGNPGLRALRTRRAAGARPARPRCPCLSTRMPVAPELGCRSPAPSIAAQPAEEPGAPEPAARLTV